MKITVNNTLSSGLGRLADSLYFLEAQAGETLWVQVQHDLHSKFQDIQGYIEKLCLKNKIKQNKQTINKTLPFLHVPQEECVT